MEQYGARPTDASKKQFNPGDIIADPTTNTNVRIIPPTWGTKMESIQFPSSRYAATIDFNLGACFYADVFGPLPFAFGSVRPEEFKIFHFQGYK